MTKARRSMRVLWKRWGRYCSALVVACFFLPFFGVSCQGIDMVTASGADMVGGCRPGGMLTEAADQKSERHAGEGGMDADIKIDNVDREPLAMVAMGVCVAILALSFLSTRGALVGCLLLAIAGLGSLGGLYAKVSKDIDRKLSETGKGAIDKEMTKDKDVSAGSRYGLWVVGLGLIGIAGVTAAALREKDQSADAGGST